MRRSFYFSMGFTIFTGILFVLWLEQRPQWMEQGAEWVGSLASRSEEPPVLVLLVSGRSGVAAVRSAVGPERVVAATPEAVALTDGRVIATSAEAASAPINAAGWVERSIEIWTPGAAPASTTAATAGAGNRPGGRQRHARAPTVAGLSMAELARKDTLTVTEAMALLKLMDSAP